MKWYAIKNPKGEWVEDAVATTEHDAWEYAGDTDHDFPRHPEYPLSESGEAAGYRCVEVELAEPGATDALKRAREAWDAMTAMFDRSSDIGDVMEVCAVHMDTAAYHTLDETLGEVKP